MSADRVVGLLSPSSTKKSEEIYRRELEAINTEAVEGSLQNMEKKFATSNILFFRLLDNPVVAGVGIAISFAAGD
ncbi:hypothetical protein P879_04246 [Paragonimus westermani]|uniref:Uncharacterized protein n=1 Tax=Paragonimus westermani TaxID=34504 RepID=A0A8T0CZX0_9TREM|nr:hypothetical protein P879_04246 [Paragonimus westermani]